MRISDWSSDVCSSDLGQGIDFSGTDHRVDHPPRIALQMPGPVPGQQPTALHRWQADAALAQHRGLFSRAQAGQDTLRPGVVLQVRFAQIERARVSHVTTGMEGHAIVVAQRQIAWPTRSEEHTSELQSLMRLSYAVFCL